MTNEADGLAAVEIARRMLTHLDECDRIGKFASTGTDHIRQICEALTSTPAARMLAGEGECGDRGAPLCPACSLPAHELTQVPGCGAPMQRSPTLTGDDDEKAEVTQADRDMAADVLFHVDGDPFVDNIREGWEDDSYIVQAFARHRIAALFYPPAAEPVGVREAEGKLVATARRNIRTFISSATFKSENDRQAALACVEVLEEHINGLGDLVTVLRSAFAAASSLATHPPAVAER